MFPSTHTNTPTNRTLLNTQPKQAEPLRPKWSCSERLHPVLKVLSPKSTQFCKIIQKLMNNTNFFWAVIVFHNNIII
uniref:Uncharacterized protein n=1 Tax=Anguilla anguilla TaxID=7936 RepID=A0A0E9Q5E4_ANGAN